MRPRKSGEMFTSLGNTLLNKLTIEFARSTYTKLSDVFYLTEGDDSVIACNDEVFLHYTASVQSSLGLDNTITIRQGITGTTFCKQIL